MDASMIRQHFPIFSKLEKPFIYFDSGATTQKPEAVINRLVQYYSYENSNIHRGNYPLSNHASDMICHARETVQKWLHAEFSDEIV